MEILVYGAGSLGSLVGGLLARTHDVTLVGRDPHMRRVREAGLRIEGAIEAHTHPRALTDGTGQRAELAIVTTKAYDTDAAARALATGEYEIVLSLQNGLTEERLVAGLDWLVLSGTATYGARFRGPGRVECTGEGEIVLGTLTAEPSRHAKRAADAFTEAGLEATAVTDMPRRRWEKLAVNAGINAPTALADVDNGAMVDGPAAEVAETATRETARVARAGGVDLPGDAAVAALERVAKGTADNHSSMRQDLEAGRRTEVDAIYGAIVERAAAAGVGVGNTDVGVGNTDVAVGDTDVEASDTDADADVDVTTCRTLAALVRAWEAGRGLRPEPKSSIGHNT